MSESIDICVVTTTVKSLEEANRIAQDLVSQCMAACVQVDGPVTSHYRWAGECQESTEFRLTIKTSQNACDKLVERLEKTHPYDEPEIIVQEIDRVSAGYGRWVIDQTT